MALGDFVLKLSSVICYPFCHPQIVFQEPVCMCRWLTEERKLEFPSSCSQDPCMWSFVPTKRLDGIDSILENICAQGGLLIRR